MKYAEPGGKDMHSKEVLKTTQACTVECTVIRKITKTGHYTKESQLPGGGYDELLFHAFALHNPALEHSS
jgi:hypothetical protein